MSEKNISGKSILVKMDVHSLHKNIPVREGISAIEKALKQKNLVTRDITILLHLVLKQFLIEEEPLYDLTVELWAPNVLHQVMLMYSW